MKRLWIVTVAMVASGVVLALAGLAAGLGPVALLCGVLLIWSGIVKVIVLRVWRAELPGPPLAERDQASTRSSTRLGEPA